MLGVIFKRKTIKRKLKELKLESENYHKDNFRQIEEYRKQKELGKMIDLIGKGTLKINDFSKRRQEIKKGINI